MENRINAALSADDLSAIQSGIATIKSKLPFLIDLQPEDRQGLAKMGDKSRAFVAKALEVAAQNDDILPRFFQTEEFRRDVELYEALYPVLLSINQLQEMLDDSLLAIGSESFTAALVVYQSAKAHKKGASLDSALDELGKRFARKAGLTTPEPAQPVQ